MDKRGHYERKLFRKAVKKTLYIVIFLEEASIADVFFFVI